MDRSRLAWLVAVPLTAAAAAMLLGAAAAATAAVVLTPFDGAEVTISESGRSLLAMTLADLDHTQTLAAVLIGLVLAELTWAVGLGVGAQALFPRRRRLIPALSAVLLGLVCGWVALGVLAAGALVLEVAAAPDDGGLAAWPGGASGGGDPLVIVAVAPDEGHRLAAAGWGSLGAVLVEGS